MATSPIRSVTIAKADSRVSGSNEVAVALRFSAGMGMFNTARWSAMKKASKRPRSNVWMKRTRCLRLKLASGKRPRHPPPGGVDADRAHEGTEVKLLGHAGNPLGCGPGHKGRLPARCNRRYSIAAWAGSIFSATAGRFISSNSSTEGALTISIALKSSR